MVVVSQSIGIISETVSRRLTAKWTTVLVDGQQWRKALGLDILALVGIEDTGIKPLPRALRTFIDLGNYRRQWKFSNFISSEIYQQFFR